MAEVRNTTDTSDARAALDAIVGKSDWAEQIRTVIAAVAAYPSSIMITGPSGTGKELIARAIHALSPRSGNRFIPVDCASVTGTLFASHMFGHRKGAFTGATHASMGCFRAADGGTIFLDEVGELELDLQAKLLRVLQERVVVPVGSHDGVPVNVRVVCASNRDLRQEVAAGRFREDLYYRLNVVAMQTAPLCERPEDIEILANYFLAQFAAENGMPRKRLLPAAVEHLQRYPWPGNVRELENAMERAVLFSPGDAIGPEVLPALAADETARELDTPSVPFDAGFQPVILRPDLPAADALVSRSPDDGHWLTAAEVECEHIRRTLERADYNQSTAARMLGIDRHQLRRRMAMHRLDTSRSKQGRPSLRPGDPRRAA
jgi:DNA-binding NtrC family response regulator